MVYIIITIKIFKLWLLQTLNILLKLEVFYTKKYILEQVIF